MNNVVKGILIFLGGTIAGGSASYFFTKNVLEERAAKDISDRVQEALAEYKAHEMSKLNNDIKEEIKDRIIKKDVEEKFEPIMENYRKKVERYVPFDIPVEEPKEAPDDEDILEKHNAFDESRKLSEDDILAEEEDENDIPDKGETGDAKATPYIISPQEFQYDHQEDYEKESFIFFKDNILTDENYKEINVEDALKLLGGPKIFTSFGSKGAKDNVVYIRNETLHTDYEVYHSPRKYTQEVLNMEDDDEEE